MSDLELIQSINLYQGVVKKKAVLLGAKHQCLAAISCCLILAGISFQQNQHIEDMTSQLKTRQQQLNEIKVTQQALLSKKENYVINEQLPEEIRRLNKIIQRMRQLSLLIEKQSKSHSMGFSSHFDSMAKAVIKGTWLTAIKLDQGGRFIQLKGLANAPENVPSLLAKLGEHLVFENRTFASMFLQRSEDKPNLIEFTIQTKE